MRKRMTGMLGALAVSSLMLAACSSGASTTTSSSAAPTDTAASSAAPSSAAPSSSAPAAGGVGVGVILPDSASSARWETADRKYLTAAFGAAGIKADIQNAGGDKAKFQTLADQMINEGVKVILMANLDSDTGSAVIKKATAAGIKVIDYDRLTLGGGAAFYVSFDNEAVGKLQGEGLKTCLDAAGKTTANIVYLNGSPTDNNATLFKQGYDSVLRPLITAGKYKLVADQSVPDWDNTKAGTIFEQIFNTANGKIDGVAAANDGLGGAVIAVLKRNGLNGRVPVTGQDATDEGLQRVLAGDQCMTVYKAIKKEADAASALAIAIIQGKDTAGLATGKTMDSKTKADVPSVLLIPQAIFKAQVKDVIADGFTTKDKVCIASVAAACAANGIS